MLATRGLSLRPCTAKAPDVNLCVLCVCVCVCVCVQVVFMPLLLQIIVKMLGAWDSGREPERAAYASTGLPTESTGACRTLYSGAYSR